jgi:hypothetical protein
MRRQPKNRFTATLALGVGLVGPAMVLADDRGNEKPRSADSASASDVAPSAQDDAAQTTASRGTSSPAATPAEIAAWITELDDNRYLVRERASQQLLEAGSPALDPLLNTANGERPEPSDRAVWILRRMSTSKDRSLRRPALERLTRLQNRPQVAAAAHETLIALRHSEALEALQALGGRYSESQGIGPYPFPRVILDPQWRGGDAGLAHLEGLAAVGTVAVIGTDITADGLMQLQKIEGLRDLVLYGTGLEEEEKDKLQKALPQVTIDFRRGALLGVGSSAAPGDGTGSPLVATVQPGSVAEAAGIKVGDVIRRFEGNDVTSFKALTEMIGEHRAGDKVTLEVVRDGQPIQFTLKLGAWQTFE